MKPALSIAQFGFRQTCKGAIVAALLVGLMAGIQGPAYAASYPDQKSRTQFAATLESTPALGILYGEAKNIDTPAGYIAYRVIPFMSLIVAIWALMTTTKVLRGQEEDGRGELIMAGKTTLRSASVLLFTGFSLSIAISAGISMLILSLVGTLPNMELSLSQSLLYVLAIYLPALVFAALGFFVSQLSTTRRRALFYGITVVIVAFAIRAIGNTVSDVSWLKNTTPFGWSDLLSPVVAPQLIWLAAPLFTFAVMTFLAFYVAGKRDFGEGLLPESDTAKSRFFLLGSVYQFDIRQTLPLFISWGAIALFISGLVAALSDVATQALQDSEALQGALDKLSGSYGDPKLAFLGTGLMFTVFTLLLMATTSLGNTRNIEARNYLDNLLVQPVRRSWWLGGRLLLTICATIVLALLTGFTTWAIATSQHTLLELGNFLLTCVTLSGPVIFVVGFGTLLYGLLPKMATIGMYAIIVWSFIIDIIGSIVKLEDVVAKSSLFHYVSLSPTAEPDWKTFAWLVILGSVVAIAGIYAFTKRDIISE